MDTSFEQTLEFFFILIFDFGEFISDIKARKNTDVRRKT